MKKIIATFALCISLIGVSPSYAIIPVTDWAHIGTQIVEFIRDIGVDAKTAYSETEQLVLQYKDELHAIKSAIDDTEKIIRLGKQIDRLTKANDIAGLARLAQDYSITLQELDLARWTYINWDDFGVAQFMQVAQLIGRGDAIGTSASEVDAMFANKYEGWTSYKDQVFSSGMMMDKYSEWSTINRDTIKAGLKTIGIHADGIADEADLIAKLKAKSETAEGRNQLLQVSNDMASVGIDQMMDVKSLLMTQNQMMAAFYATEQDKDDLLNAQAQSANMRELVDGKKPIIGNDTWDDTGFKMGVN